MWYLILILAVVYWSLFKIVKESNWSVFNKQSGFFLIFYSRFFLYIEMAFFYIFYFLFWRLEAYMLFINVYYFVHMSDFLEDHVFRGPVPDHEYKGDPVKNTPLYVYGKWLKDFGNAVAAAERSFQAAPISPMLKHPVIEYEHFDDDLGYILLLKLYKYQLAIEDFVGYDLHGTCYHFIGLFTFRKKMLHFFVEKSMYYYLFNNMTLGYYFHTDVRGQETFLDNQKFRHSTYFEFVCASIPSFIILLILIPSTLLLYSLDEELEPLITYKVLGHQWYWSYEFSNWFFFDEDWRKVSFNFDSSMLMDDDLELGGRRLLDVDKPLFVPVNVPLRFLITSSDVLHSWAVPELGIKIDATPGRLCHYLVLVRRPGVFFGQCSEICGRAHGFMPISIKAI